MDDARPGSRSRKSRRPRRESLEHDLWMRELLERLAWPFLQFFLPRLAALVTPGSLEVLPQRLIGRLGRGREGDLFLRAVLGGQETALILAIEHKGQPDEQDWLQLLEYTVILWRQQKMPVHPVLLLSYSEPRRLHAGAGTLETPTLKVVTFRYDVVQLNRHDWREAMASGNPAALALAGCMPISGGERVRARLEFLRALARLTLEAEEARLVIAFFEHYVRLDEEEDLQMRREMAELPEEERKVMITLTNSFIEQGRREGWTKGLMEGETKGRTEGLMEGQTKGRVEIILRMFRKRFGKEVEELEDRIRGLAPERLDELSEALLDFQSADDLRQWLWRRG